MIKWTASGKVTSVKNAEEMNDSHDLNSNIFWEANHSFIQRSQIISSYYGVLNVFHAAVLLYSSAAKAIATVVLTVKRKIYLFILSSKETVNVCITHFWFVGYFKLLYYCIDITSSEWWGKILHGGISSQQFLMVHRQNYRCAWHGVLVVYLFPWQYWAFECSPHPHLYFYLNFCIHLNIRLSSNYLLNP